MTYISLHLFGLTVKRVEEMPGGHYCKVDGQQDRNYDEQLHIFYHLENSPQKKPIIIITMHGYMYV